MATHTTLSNLFSDIADAIRAKTGSAEEIIADDFPTAIAAISGSGTPTINGKTFDCGTFTTASNITANYTVSHALGRTPEFLVLWTVNNDCSVQCVLGKWNANINMTYRNAGVIAANGGLNSGAATSNTVYRSAANATTLTLNCSATYPLLAGTTYQWLVI